MRGGALCGVNRYLPWNEPAIDERARELVESPVMHGHGRDHAFVLTLFNHFEGAGYVFGWIGESLLYLQPYHAFVLRRIGCW